MTIIAVLPPWIYVEDDKELFLYNWETKKKEVPAVFRNPNYQRSSYAAALVTKWGYTRISPPLKITSLNELPTETLEAWYQ